MDHTVGRSSSDTGATNTIQTCGRTEELPRAMGRIWRPVALDNDDASPKATPPRAPPGRSPAPQHPLPPPPPLGDTTAPKGAPGEACVTSSGSDDVTEPVPAENRGTNEVGRDFPRLENLAVPGIPLSGEERMGVGTGSDEISAPGTSEAGVSEVTMATPAESSSSLVASSTQHPRVGASSSEKSKDPDFSNDPSPSLTGTRQQPTFRTQTEKQRPPSKTLGREKLLSSKTSVEATADSSRRHAVSAIGVPGASCRLKSNVPAMNPRRGIGDAEAEQVDTLAVMTRQYGPSSRNPSDRIPVSLQSAVSLSPSFRSPSRFTGQSAKTDSGTSTSARVPMGLKISTDDGSAVPYQRPLLPTHFAQGAAWRPRDGHVGSKAAFSLRVPGHQSDRHAGVLGRPDRQFARRCLSNSCSRGAVGFFHGPCREGHTDGKARSAFKPIVRPWLLEPTKAEQHSRTEADGLFVRSMLGAEQCRRDVITPPSPYSLLPVRSDVQTSPLRGLSPLDAISLLRRKSSLYQTTLPSQEHALGQAQLPAELTSWFALLRGGNHRMGAAILDRGDSLMPPHCSPPPQVRPLPHPLSHPPRYLCEACNKSYSTFGGLSKHKQFHCASQVKKEFKCKYCDKGYSSLGALKMHIRTHTLPCKCKLCGKAFSRPWLLQGHIRTHTGEKPFACPHCARAFADRSNLRAHLQTHSDVKKYACKSCSKTFSRMSLLLKHEDGSCPGLMR